MKHRNPKPSAPPTEEALYDSAVKALGRQARSSGEVRLLLARKKATKAQIESILGRLRENGYLDDARFARYYAASRLEGDLHGKARVRRDLAARRVNKEIVEETLSAAYENVNEAKLLREFLKRKVRVTKPLSRPSTAASLYRRLLRAGFSSATIVQELKRFLPSPRFGARADEESPTWDELLESLAENSEPSSDPEAESDQ